MSFYWIADKVKENADIHVVTFTSETKCDSSACKDSSGKFFEGLIAVPDSTPCPLKKGAQDRDCSKDGCCVESCAKFNCQNQKVGDGKNVTSKQSLDAKPHAATIRHTCNKTDGEEAYIKCMRQQCCRSVCLGDHEKVSDTLTLNWPVLFSNDSFITNCWMRECQEGGEAQGVNPNMQGKTDKAKKIVDGKCHSDDPVQTTRFNADGVGGGTTEHETIVICTREENWPEMQVTHSGYVEVSNIHQNVCAKRKCTSKGWGAIEPMSDKSKCTAEPVYTTKKDPNDTNKKDDNSGLAMQLNIIFTYMILLM